MSYTPNNLSIFTAAYSGALAGMGASNRIVTNTSSSYYTNLALTAGAFAQAYDSAWGATLSTNFDISAVQQMCESTWNNRSPYVVGQFANPMTYAHECLGLVAILQAADNYLNTQNILSPVSLAPGAATQSQWQINATTGNDNNSGAPGAPLKTWAQLQSRWGSSIIQGDLTGANPNGAGIITVDVIGDLPNTDPINLDITIGIDTIIRVTGGTNIIRTGTVTATTAKTTTTNTRTLITDGYIASAAWTTDLNRRVRIVGGANDGQCAWVAKDNGSGQAAFSAFTLKVNTPTNIVFPTLGTVSNGDTYVVETMQKAIFGNISIRAPRLSTATIRTSIIQFIEFESTISQVGISSIGANQPTVCNFVSYKFTAGFCNDAVDSLGLSNFNIYLTNCFSSFINNGGTGLAVLAGLVSVGFAIGVYNRSGILILDYDFMVEAGGICCGGGTITIGKACSFNATSTNNFNTGGGGFNVQSPAAVASGGGGKLCLSGILSAGTPRMWGAGAAGAGVIVGANCSLTEATYGVISEITVTGTGGDFKMSGGAPYNTTSSPWDQTANAGAGGYLTPINNTWTNYYAAVASGGFGRGAHNLRDNSHIISNNF